MWNCRGIGNASVARALRVLIRNLSQILFLYPRQGLSLGQSVFVLGSNSSNRPSDHAALTNHGYKGHCLSQLKSCSDRINCNHLWHGCINPSWLQSLDLAKISPNLVKNSLAPAKISPYLVGISPYLSAGMQCRSTNW